MCNDAERMHKHPGEDPHSNLKSEFPQISGKVLLQRAYINVNAGSVWGLELHEWAVEMQF